MKKRRRGADTLKAGVKDNLSLALGPVTRGCCVNLLSLVQKALIRLTSGRGLLSIGQMIASVSQTNRAEHLASSFSPSFIERSHNTGATHKPDLLQDSHTGRLHPAKCHH